MMAQGHVVHRRVVRQLNPLSIVRMVFGLGLSASSIVVVGLIALYLLAVASGALRTVEGFVESWGLSFAPASFLPAVVILMAIVTATATAFAGVLAVLYNHVAELIGGVEIITRERPGRIEDPGL